MLSRTLKKLRKNCGYTQKEVAKELGVDRSTYAYYETGKTTPDANTIIKLSKILKVSFSDIFQDEECGISFADFGSPNVLSSQEKELVMKFRLLSESDRNKILDVISRRTASKNKNIATSSE